MNYCVYIASTVVPSGVLLSSGTKVYINTSWVFSDLHEPTFSEAKRGALLICPCRASGLHRHKKTALTCMHARWRHQAVWQ